MARTGEVEALTGEMSAASRRRLGIKGRLSDTTLRDVVVAIGGKSSTAGEADDHQSAVRPIECARFAAGVANPTMRCLERRPMRAFTRFSWAVLAYNVAVIAWGAVVRATGSGAGCGRHWPTCNGELLPRSPALATVIELAHRATSGAALLLVLGLAVAARRLFPAGHPARRAAAWSLGFIVIEALVGAALVLFGLVAQDTSGARGWVMAVHLVNTFLLLAALALTAHLAASPARLAPRGHASLALLFAGAAAAVLFVGVSGAVAALGDTLFPATSFADGLRAELSTGAALLLRLRVVHPFAAVFGGTVVLLAARAAARARPEPPVRRAARALVVLVVLELGAGLVNLVLLAPVTMQVVHLVLADLVWIALVLLAAKALAALPAPAEIPSPPPATASPSAA